ncbi:PD-(D/E)XK nuclease family protein [Eisenibacter elegans]|uniref:PD-(D/E)XK nuclease family protein n=1 Tax=Eisenibacter elegans TaxID=997 RepID=UPI000401E4BB|nr:PD-(D/E)XK nuclease family protein [Eisenibacter elegans]
MQSFLAQCAAHICQTYAEDLAQTVVVLPTKRATFYFKHALSAHIKPENQPVLIPIEDFFTYLTDTKVTGAMTLLLELYDVYQHLDDNIDIDRFAAWGYVLLKDFDQVDRALIDPKALFHNLYDIKLLQQWGISPEKMTERIKRYFKLWENLHSAYDAFQERLRTYNLAYQGMLYRRVAENIDHYLLNHPQHKRFLWVGMNALSHAEEQILQKLIKHNRGGAYWDSDTYYLSHNIENKAGAFLRKYKNSWASPWYFEGRAMLDGEKEVEIIAAANAAWQGQIANQLLHQWEQKPLAEVENLKTAIVLSDENLLLPVLQGLDTQHKALNITMGMSFRHSHLFHFTELFFALHGQLKRQREGNKWVYKFNYKHLLALFQHRYFRSYEQAHLPPESGEKRLSHALIWFINKHNKFALSQEELLEIDLDPVFQEDFAQDLALYKAQLASLRPLLELLLTRVGSVGKLIDQLEALLLLLPSGQAHEEAMELEYRQLFQEVLADIRQTLNRYKTHNKGLYRQISENRRFFRTLLYQALRQETIVFDSDRLSPLQLMGLLETRALDFEQVIILSANEGILPHTKKINSFIPLDIARSYGLPTYSDQDAIISYHFYRLLQRAQRVALVYVAPSDTYGAKERSRLLYQIESDWVQANPKLKVRTRQAQYRTRQAEQSPELRINKSPWLLQKVKQQITQSGLSPAHINTFIACSLKYFFAEIIGLQAPQQTSDELGADKFGTIIHEILEELFTQMASKNLHRQVGISDIEQMLPQVPGIVEEKFKQSNYVNYDLTGENYITKEVAVTFMEQFLKAQIAEIQKSEQPFEIILLENVKDDTDKLGKRQRENIITTFETIIHGETLRVKITGIIDRLDQIGPHLRIIDYKTGKVRATELHIKTEELERLHTDPMADKLRQLWIYKYIVAKELFEKQRFLPATRTQTPPTQLSAGVYALREPEKFLLSLEEKGQSPQLSTQDWQGFIQTSEYHLEQIIRKMLDPQEDFAKTTDTDTCQYCIYKDICNR